jgi:hypothetical protein
MLLLPLVFQDDIQAVQARRAAVCPAGATEQPIPGAGRATCWGSWACKSGDACRATELTLPCPSPLVAGQREPF